MDALFSIEAIGVLVTLIFLQAVLGFDNLLYISIESRRAPLKYQAMVRKLGIGIAVLLRLVLLFLVLQLLESFSAPLFTLGGYGAPEPSNFAPVRGEFTLKAVIFLFGGGFIMYTAVKEINHLLSIDDLEHEDAGGSKSAFTVIALIVFMNLIFSFDSILSMLPLTSQFSGWAQFTLMAIAVVISGALMILLADRVAAFIQKNRMFEVLGLFILLIVGVLLLGEGGHVAHMELFGYKVEPMSKSTFYFSIAMLFLVNIIQTQYQKKLQAKKRREAQRIAAGEIPK